MQRRMTKKPMHLKLRPCGFCETKTEPDYKNTGILSGYVTERGKIMGAGRSGVCSHHQRALSRAIKRSRFLAFLPFIVKA